MHRLGGAWLVCCVVSLHCTSGTQSRTLQTNVTYPAFLPRDDVIEHYIHGAVLQYNVTFRQCEGDLPFDLRDRLMTYSDVTDAAFAFQQFNYPYYRLFLMAETRVNGSYYNLTEPVVRVFNLTMVTDQRAVLAVADFHSRSGDMLSYGTLTCPYGHGPTAGLTFLALSPWGQEVTDLGDLIAALREGRRVFYCVHSELCVTESQSPQLALPPSSNATSPPPPLQDVQYDEYEGGWIKDYDVTLAGALYFADRHGDFYYELVEVSIYPGNMADVVVSQLFRGLFYPWPIVVQRKFCQLGSQGGLQLFSQ